MGTSIGVHNTGIFNYIVDLTLIPFYVWSSLWNKLHTQNTEHMKTWVHNCHNANFVALNNRQKSASLYLIFDLPYSINLLITDQLPIPPFVSLETLAIFWKIVLKMYFLKVWFLKKCCVSINPNLWHWLWKRTDMNERKCVFLWLWLLSYYGTSTLWI